MGRIWLFYLPFWAIVILGLIILYTLDLTLGILLLIAGLAGNTAIMVVIMIQNRSKIEANFQNKKLIRLAFFGLKLVVVILISFSVIFTIMIVLLLIIRY